jgi:hypothetical protein
LNWRVRGGVLRGDGDGGTRRGEGDGMDFVVVVAFDAVFSDMRSIHLAKLRRANSSIRLDMSLSTSLRVLGRKKAILTIVYSAVKREGRCYM